MEKMYESPILPDEQKPALAESFEIEFLNTNKIKDKLIDMGFRVIRLVPEGDKVRIEGESVLRDGTKIEIIVTKGENYKSPKELADEASELEQK